MIIPLNIDPQNERRLKRQLDLCPAFRFVKVYPGTISQEAELEASFDMLESGMSDDIRAMSMHFPIGMEFLDLSAALKYHLDIVIRHGFMAVRFARSRLQRPFIDMVKYVHKNRSPKLFESHGRTDSIYHLINPNDSAGLNYLYSTLSEKLSTLNIDCSRAALKHGLRVLPLVSGVYAAKLNTLYLYPLGAFANKIASAPRGSRVFSVSKQLVASTMVETFLHELAHILEPCIFESKYLRDLIDEKSEIAGTDNLQEAQVTEYESVAAHCTRFKLTLLYLIEKSEARISSVRPEIFEDVMNSILAEQNIAYEVTSHAPWIIRGACKLLGVKAYRLRDIDLKKRSPAYEWEWDLADKLNKVSALQGMERPVFCSRIEIRETVETFAEYRAFVRDRRHARPNYARSDTGSQGTSVWDVEDFAFTLNGEANLYLAISDNEDPFDVIAQMALIQDVKRLDEIPTDLVGIYIVSRGQSYEIVYAQRGFDPVEISLEEAWWLLIP